MSHQEKWYEVKDINNVDSPSLLIYPDRVRHNIELAMHITGDYERLRPHVKTHKLPEIIQIHVEEYGITKFKAATIAEAEMIAMNGGEDVILAHQPTPPKIPRLMKLIRKYPKTTFRIIVDCASIIGAIEHECIHTNMTCNLLLDIDNGMQRSGIPPNEEAFRLYKRIHDSYSLTVGGLHIYDGHIRDKSFEDRKSVSDKAYDSVNSFVERLKAANLPVPRIVCGGSPTFPVHALRTEVEVSPGTYVFWDMGYGKKFPDLEFQHAAIVCTRIFSKLADNIACVDLGHKSIASENPHPRVYFLNCKVEKFLVHSEEHLVIQSEDLRNMEVGDVLYGVPHHICPTVNLNEEVVVIENGYAVDRWEVVGRKRKISC